MNTCLKLAFALALTVLLSANAHGRGRYGAAAASSPRVVRCAVGSSPQLMRFATELDGDHSLDAATVAEQGFGSYARYTVRLQFTSGREQSIAINAPPGGLQPEMLDMSGDNIPNDLVLTSRLLRWPLVVLLNDGNDHLTVAVAPGRFAPGEDKASGGRSAHRASALVGPRVRLPELRGDERVPGANPSERIRGAAAPILMQAAAYARDSGRAPPALPVQG
jgi:hypothetical protein